MSDDQVAKDEPHSVAFSIIDTWKLKAPCMLPTLPPEFHTLIGRVATTWGVFEAMFENFLIALIKSRGVTNDNWRGLTFRKKRKLFNDEVDREFKTNPTIIAYITEMLDMIEPLYIKRNLAVHGRMQVRLENSLAGGKTVLICAGRYKGNDIQQEFTPDQLDDLYYDVGHLLGFLNVISVAGPDRTFSSNDISRLQDFLANNHPTYPNPAMLPPQPQPSHP